VNCILQITDLNNLTDKKSFLNIQKYTDCLRYNYHEVSQAVTFHRMYAKRLVKNMRWGKSGHHRAGCFVMRSACECEESATEMMTAGKDAPMVRLSGKGATVR